MGNLIKEFDRFWVPEGLPVALQGYAINDGLLYVGENLAAADGEMLEPGLINPALKVDSARPDRIGEYLDDKPDYDTMPPRCRAAYLRWLAGGRRDPDTYVGYVFLFLYGLERRIFHDHATGTADPKERGAIFREIKRLLRLYGNNDLFAPQAQAFLFAIYLGASDADLTAKPPVMAAQTGDLPAPLKVGLGQFAKAGRPIPADWALAWALQDPQILPHPPHGHNLEEFALFFKRLYGEIHRDGLVVEPGETSLAIRYRPANIGIPAPVDVYRGPELPDIACQERPRALLAEIAERTIDQLQASSIG